MVKESFTSCAITASLDGSEDDEIHCFKLAQPCEEGRSVIADKMKHFVTDPLMRLITPSPHMTVLLMTISSFTINFMQNRNAIIVLTKHNLVSMINNIIMDTTLFLQPRWIQHCFFNCFLHSSHKISKDRIDVIMESLQSIVCVVSGHPNRSSI